MRTWRGKFVFLLVIYFAGYATAIYTLAPVPEKRTRSKSVASSVFKSDDFAQSFNSAMHKCVDYGKEVAIRTGKRMKQKIKERRRSR